MVRDLTEQEEVEFESGLYGYGSVIGGGTKEERVEKLQEYINFDATVVNCQGIESIEEFYNELMESHSNDSSVKKENPDPIDVTRVINQSQNPIAILEFDSVSEELQKIIAQSMKGIIENSGNWDDKIAYTAENPDAVVEAQLDLAGRVRSIEL